MHQNLKYAPTLLKINRMALVKTVKYETSTLLFFFLYFAPRSENKSLGPHHCVDGNGGQEGGGHVRQEAADSSSRDLRDDPGESLFCR